MSEIDALLARLREGWALAAQPGTWAQVAVLALAALLAWLVHRRLARLYIGAAAGEGLRRLTRRSLQRVSFPLVMLFLTLAGRAVLRTLVPSVAVLNVAVPLLVSLALIRVVVYMLRKGFAPSPALKSWENIISGTVWTLVALYLFGWLGPIVEALNQLAVQIGTTRLSLLAVIKVVLLLGFLFTVALWLARVVETRVARSQHISAAMQVGLAKFAKFFLLAIAALLTIEAAGIDLTTFTVFGGALGVGLGFGLQRIASNFISGFILIFDHSIKPGDVISIGNNFGWVQELRARYLVVRNRDGVETLIPNENLITSEVINWSYSDRAVRLRIPVQISYADDPEQAMVILEEAAGGCARVLADPAPVARLMEFGDNGIALEVRVWLSDPENGLHNVRSDINVAIWRRFKAAGITIPFPQRDVHVIPHE